MHHRPISKFRTRRALLPLLAAMGAFKWSSARALTLADLSSADATAGIKAALERGTGIAVELLGRSDGFWGNDLVRIPLPEWLQRSERMLRFAGMGRDIDALKLGINRAAEQAVPEAKALLVQAVRGMTVQDAKGILTGGDDSVTRFFADKTRQPLSERFLPIVAGVTDRIGLAQQYNALAAQGAQFGLVKPEQARIEDYVTAKALDGLYLTIAQEEKRLRKDPAAAGSAIVRKVFGAL